MKDQTQPTETPESADDLAVGSNDLLAFLDNYDLEAVDVIDLGYQGKSGKLSRRDAKLISKISAVIYTQKFKHIKEEYFKLIKQGADKAMGQVNPFS